LDFLIISYQLGLYLELTLAHLLYSGIARIFQVASPQDSPASRGYWKSKGPGGKAPSRRRQEGRGAEPPALGEFCNFSINITHFMHISAKLVNLKNTLQLKAFKISLNVLNRIDVTKYDVTFSTRGKGVNPPPWLRHWLYTLF